MTSKLNGVRRTLFPSDTDDIASAKSTNSINSKFSAIRWINPNVIIFIISATILTIYGKVQTQLTFIRWMTQLKSKEKVDVISRISGIFSFESA